MTILEALDDLLWYLVLDPIEYPSGVLRATKHVQMQHAATLLSRIMDRVKEKQ